MKGRDQFHWIWLLPGLLLLMPLLLGLQPRPQARDPQPDRASLVERVRLGKGVTRPELGYLFRGASKAKGAYVPGELLVRFKKGVSTAQVAALHRRLGTTVLLESRMVPGLQWVRLPVHLSVEQAIKLFKESQLVQYAEPNYLVHVLQAAYPNDPFVQIRDTATHPFPGYYPQCDPEASDTDGKSWFTYAWDLQMATACTYVDPFLCPSGFGCGGNNAGRPDLGVLPCTDPKKCVTVESQGAWTHVPQTTPQDVLVMVIDTGVDYTHPDVAANMWVNPGEVPGNGLDDDQNGIVDDVHGIRTIGAGGEGPGCGSANFGDPMDDFGHGTHVASTIAARANNFAGLVGMGGLNNRVKIIGCKFLDSSGTGTTADAIKCFEYAYYLKVQRGFNLVATSNSWGGGAFSWALYDAIAANRDAGILAVFAAGNATSDNDTTDNFPSNYDLDNIIAVGSMNQHDCASSFSNWGGRSVDIFAPGSLILGACPWPLVGMCSGDPNAPYVFASGTSMATPHVTGLAALLKAIQPSLQWWQIRNIILTTGVASTMTDAGCSAVGGSGDDVDGGTFQSYTGDGTPAGKKSVTDKRINALRAAQVAAAGSGPGDYDLQARIWPYGMGPFNATQGHPFVIKVMNVNGWNVGAPGSVTAVINPGGCTITFVDDGTPPDQVAGDGIFVGSFAFDTAPCDTPGTYTIDIQVNATTIETLTVNVASPMTYTVGPGTAPMTVNVCTTGTVILSGSDDGEANFTTTLAYPFAGTPYTQWRAGNNGALLVGVTAGDVPFTNTPLPTASFGQALAIYWDDLYGPGAPTGTVVYEEVPSGDARNTTGENLLVVAWCNQAHFNFGGSDRWTFQLAIGASSGKIWYQYFDTTGQAPSVDHGASATVGVQMSPDSAVQYSFNSPSVPDGTVLLFTPVTTAVGVLQVVPDPLNFAFVGVGQSKTLPVHIQNIGTAPFDVTSVGPSPVPDFAVSCPTTPFTVNPGMEVLCSVTFTPSFGGPQSASIPVATTVGSGSINVQGTGVGPYPDIHLPASTLDFGTVVWGHTQVQNLSVQNLGAANLIISGVDNSLAPSVTVTTTLPLTVAPSTSDVLGFSWNSATGCLDSRVGIVSNDPDESNVQVRVLARTSIADVASGVDYYVQRLISNQVTSGCGTEASVYGVDLNGDGDTTDLVYCPNAALNRAQMAIFISRAVLGTNPPASGSGPNGSWNCTDGLPNPFTDVLDTDFYCPHVHWMWANGITSGCTATTYCPFQTVTRAQMSIFLQRAFHLQCR